MCVIVGVDEICKVRKCFGESNPLTYMASEGPELIGQSSPGRGNLLFSSEPGSDCRSTAGEAASLDPRSLCPFHQAAGSTDMHCLFPPGSKGTCLQYASCMQNRRSGGKRTSCLNCSASPVSVWLDT